MSTAKTLIAGASSLFIAMGLARFAFTPHLPLMQKDFMFNDTFSGILASSNYLGYLLGSILSLKISRFKNIYRIFAVSIWLSLILMVVMYFTNSYLWVILRFFSGLLSAILFVLTMIMTLNDLLGKGKPQLSGIMHSGLGLGMVISGFALPILYRYYNSSELWICLVLISLIPAALSMLIPACESTSESESIQNSVPPKGINLLYISYFLEGLGYIVTGTFISVIVLRNTGSVELSGNVWVIAGLGAMIITPFYPMIAKRAGTAQTLAFLFFIQSIAIALPVLSNNTFLTMAGAVGYGGTFLGIVILSLMYAREIHPAGKTTALLTIYFSIGQIIGPVTSGYISDWSGSFRLPVLSAALLVFTGGFTVLASIRIRNKTSIS